MTNIRQLIYVSHATQAFQESELPQMAIGFQKSNAQSDIDGLLIYSNGLFIQLIEGRDEGIEALFSKIRLDPRHKDVVLLSDRAAAERSFPHWDMNVIFDRSTTGREKLARINRKIATKANDPGIAFELLCEFITPARPASIVVGAFG